MHWVELVMAGGLLVFALGLLIQGELFKAAALTGIAVIYLKLNEQEEP